MNPKQDLKKKFPCRLKSETTEKQKPTHRRCHWKQKDKWPLREWMVTIS